MASRRLSRVTKLRRASRKSLARAARASPGASLLFGSTQVGIAPGRLRAVRRRFARALTKLPLRTATGLFTASSRALAEADPGHLHHAAVMKHWAVVVQSGVIDERTLAIAVGGSALKLVHSTWPWRRVTGPTSALLATLCRLQWQLDSPFTLRTDD
eukprot:4102621-Amphidinium_carterae.1